MVSARKTYLKAQDEVARLESFLKTHIAYTTREIIQAIKQAKAKSKVACMAHDEAKQEAVACKTVFQLLV
jgi:cbb3-type cytochrome oxidase cytochrome c subunit